MLRRQVLGRNGEDMFHLIGNVGLFSLIRCVPDGMFVPIFKFAYQMSGCIVVQATKVFKWYES